MIQRRAPRGIDDLQPVIGWIDRLKNLDKAGVTTGHFEPLRVRAEPMALIAPRGHVIAEQDNPPRQLLPPNQVIGQSDGSESRIAPGMDDVGILRQPASLGVGGQAIDAPLRRINLAPGLFPLNVLRPLLPFKLGQYPAQMKFPPAIIRRPAMQRDIRLWQ